VTPKRAVAPASQAHSQCMQDAWIWLRDPALTLLRVALNKCYFYNRDEYMLLATLEATLEESGWNRLPFRYLGPASVHRLRLWTDCLQGQSNLFVLLSCTFVLMHAQWPSRSVWSTQNLDCSFASRKSWRVLLLLHKVYVMIHLGMSKSSQDWRSAWFFGVSTIPP
jgi:hypothetical protein